MSALYRVLMYAGSWVCHQLPGRSPHLFGVQLPLCWRCTGIFFGALALFLWLLAKKKLPPLLLCLLLSLLLPLDVFYNVFTHGDGDNARRFITACSGASVPRARHFNCSSSSRTGSPNRRLTTPRPDG